MIRINKYLSLCGVTSRRGADSLITEGRVTLNDSTIEEKGVIVDETEDVVKVDGVEVKPVEEKVYLILNKPGNAMTTLRDPFKRKTIMHYLKKLPHRVYPVGRLDFDTQGALLLTNDGDLAYRLAHPRYGVKKIYEALVTGHFKPDDAKLIKAGIKLEDGAIGRAEVIILGFVKNTTRIRLTLTEGRKREVKQLCKKVKHPVASLKRVEFAGISLKDLRAGKWRYLTDKEINRLKKMVELN